jgi:hypothetical protein
MSANTYGRQVVIAATNKSGGGLIAGDVCVIDTTNNLAFTTDTSGGFTGTVGIAQGTIANNAAGLFAISGYVSLVNVNASVTRGHYGKTFTVAKQATDAGSSRGVGTFCEFTTGGTTPDAVMWSVDLLGSSLTNPMTTKGDVILGDTGGTPTRLGAGTSAFVLTSNGAAAFPSWQAAPAGTLTLHGCLAYEITGTQSIPGSADTKLTFTSETFDTDAYHSTSSNTSRITVPSGLDGYYLVGGHVQWAQNGTGVRAMRVEKNGATVNGAGNQNPGNAGTAIGFETSVVVHLVATDYVEINVFQSSGGALVSGGTNGFDSNAIWAYFLGT